MFDHHLFDSCLFDLFDFLICLVYAVVEYAVVDNRFKILSSMVVSYI